MNRDYKGLMEQITMPADCEERILAALEHRPKRVRRPVRFLLAAALIAVMATSAVALAPALQEYAKGAAGEFAPYINPVEGTGIAEEGYEMRVISAVSDRYMTYIYVEIRDPEGHIAESLDMSKPLFTLIERKNPNPKQRGGGITGTYLIHCDPDGETALLAVMQWGLMGGTDPEVILKFVDPLLHCEIPTTLEYVPIQTIDLSGLELGDRLIPLDHLEISPLSIGIMTQYQEDATDESTKSVEKMRGELTVHYADGSQRSSIQHNFHGVFSQMVSSWLFMDPYEPVQPEDLAPLEMENIVGLSCKKWYLPIENGVAGPLQWTD